MSLISEYLACVAPTLIPFTDEGQIWHARSNVWFIDVCQISARSIRTVVPAGRKIHQNSAISIKFWNWGLCMCVPSQISAKFCLREGFYNLSYNAKIHFWSVHTASLLAKTANFANFLFWRNSLRTRPTSDQSQI